MPIVGNLLRSGVTNPWYFAPLAFISIFGCVLLFLQWQKKYLPARLLALMILHVILWNGALLYGKSFNGYLIFFPTILYAVVSFSREHWAIKWGTLFITALNLPFIDYLSHRKIIPITGFHSDNFDTAVLIIDSISVIGMITIMMTVEKFFSDKYEDQLTDLNENLEQIVEKRTKMLVDAKEEAIQASLLKSQFVANASHELRTPLQGLMGFVTMVQRRLSKFKSLSEEDQAILHKIESSLASAESSSARLLKLIDTLLKITRTESQGFEARPSHFDFEGVINEVIKGLSSVATAKGNAVSLHSKTQTKQVYTDRTLLVQVLENLIGNAIRYSTSGTPIHVFAEELETQMKVSVQNVGPGIDPQELEKIFEPFVQGSRTDKTTGGTGLGLSLCRKYTAALGGTVHLVDHSPERTTFTFTFIKALPQGQS